MIDLFLHFQNKRRNRSEKLLKLAQSATIFCGGSGKFAAGVGGRSCHCDRSQGGLHQSVAYPTLDAPTFGLSKRTQTHVAISMEQIMTIYL